MDMMSLTADDIGMLTGSCILQQALRTMVETFSYVLIPIRPVS